MSRRKIPPIGPVHHVDIDVWMRYRPCWWMTDRTTLPTTDRRFPTSPTSTPLPAGDTGTGVTDVSGSRGVLDRPGPWDAIDRTVDDGPPRWDRPRFAVVPMRSCCLPTATIVDVSSRREPQRSPGRWSLTATTNPSRRPRVGVPMSTRTPRGASPLEGTCDRRGGCSRRSTPPGKPVEGPRKWAGVAPVLVDVHRKGAPQLQINTLRCRPVGGYRGCRTGQSTAKPHRESGVCSKLSKYSSFSPEL